MKRLLVILLLLYATPLLAQKTPSNPLGGNLTVQDAGTCSTTGSFLWQQLPSNAATTIVNLAGTFSGTLTIRLSNNGGGSWTTNSTTTSAGNTSISTNGFTDICADVTTFTSGSFGVTITTGLNTGPQGPAGPAGSGGGGNGVTPAYNTTSDFFPGSSLNARWTTYINGFTVSSGAVTGTTASQLNVAALTGVSTVSSTQYSTVIIGTAATSGPAVRISGTIGTNVSYYVCTETSTQLQIQKVTGASNSSTGSNTSLVSATIAALPGDKVTLSIVGNDLTCQRNGSSNSPLQVHDTSLTTGLPGFSMFSNTGTLTSVTISNPACPTGAAVCIIADGDSITAANGNGSNNTDPYTTYLQISSSNSFISNLGVSSKCLGVVCSTFASMVTTGTSVVDTLCLPGAKNIVIIMGGTNDIANGSRTAAQVYTDLTTYVTNRHAAAGCNWQVVVVPQVSRGNGGVTDQTIQTLNALIYANSAGADAVVQLPASITTVGASGNAFQGVLSGSFTGTASGASIGVSTQIVTVQGVSAGDNVALVSAPAPTSLCPLTTSRATGTNGVSLDFAVLTAAACTPATGTYKFIDYSIPTGILFNADTVHPTELTHIDIIAKAVSLTLKGLGL